MRRSRRGKALRLVVASATVMAMSGIYRGLVDDAVSVLRAMNADLWVVEAGTNGPFAEASRISGDTRELVSRVYGVQRAGSVTYQSVQTELSGKPLRMFLIGFEPGRPGGPRVMSGTESPVGGTGRHARHGMRHHLQ